MVVLQATLVPWCIALLLITGQAAAEAPYLSRRLPLLHPPPAPTLPAVATMTIASRLAPTQTHRPIAARRHYHVRDVPIATTPPPPASTSACQSIALSLFTHAPTVPSDILSFEASWLMTASACQTITPPKSLSMQWAGWTSNVSMWLDAHSAEYTSYLSRCEAWQLSAADQCPDETGTATATTTVTIHPTSGSTSGVR